MVREKVAYQLAREAVPKSSVERAAAEAKGPTAPAAEAKGSPTTRTGGPAKGGGKGPGGGKGKGKSGSAGGKGPGAPDLVAQLQAKLKAKEEECARLRAPGDGTEAAPPQEFCIGSEGGHC